MAEMKKAAIFCGGIIEDYGYLSDRAFDEYFLICADGGLRHMNKLGIIPNVIIGDNDSWTEEYPNVEKVILHKPEKDDSDTKLCIDYAIENGYNYIELYGALGGRRDHEFSHYCLMKYGLERGARVKIVDEHNEIWMENKPFTIGKTDRKYISFFAFGGDVSGFSIAGLKYGAEDILLKSGSTLAISNEFVNSDKAEVFFKGGTIMVMLCEDARQGAEE